MATTSFKKLSEELDFLQKRVASLRDAYRLYPDTIIKTSSGPKNSSEECTYLSAIVNSDVDVVQFAMNGFWLNAYPLKKIGCIDIHSLPNCFSLLICGVQGFGEEYDRKLVIQNFQDTMRKHKISETIIRECDLKVISYIKEHKSELSNSNISSIDPNSSIRKLLSLI